METKINVTVSVSQDDDAQAVKAQQEERQPIDRSNEVLISNETSFNGLIAILRKAGSD